MKGGTFSRRNNPSVIDGWKAPYWTPTVCSGGSCGTNAIGMLTGLSARAIERHRPKSNTYWAPATLRKFLRRRGFQLFRLTECSVTYFPDRHPKYQNVVTPQHVVLLLLDMCRSEMSYMILHQSTLWHNGTTERITPLTFVNAPIVDAHVVWKPSWAKLRAPAKEAYVGRTWGASVYCGAVSA